MGTPFHHFAFWAGCSGYSLSAGMLETPRTGPVEACLQQNSSTVFWGFGVWIPSWFGLWKVGEGQGQLAGGLSARAPRGNSETPQIRQMSVPRKMHAQGELKRNKESALGIASKELPVLRFRDTERLRGLQGSPTGCYFPGKEKCWWRTLGLDARQASRESHLLASWSTWLFGGLSGSAQEKFSRIQNGIYLNVVMWSVTF